MKLFKDLSLKEEIQTLDLGIVDAGTSEKFTYYVFNNKEAKLTNIKFTVDHSEVFVISSPKELKREI